MLILKKNVLIYYYSWFFFFTKSYFKRRAVTVFSVISRQKIHPLMAFNQLHLFLYNFPLFTFFHFGIAILESDWIILKKQNLSPAPFSTLLRETAESN